ncbi:hypothetical protein LguiA_020784 [Lonicera macranthoides]
MINRTFYYSFLPLLCEREKELVERERGGEKERKKEQRLLQSRAEHRSWFGTFGVYSFEFQKNTQSNLSIHCFYPIIPIFSLSLSLSLS